MKLSVILTLATSTTLPSFALRFPQTVPEKTYVQPGKPFSINITVDEPCSQRIQSFSFWSFKGFDNRDKKLQLFTWLKPYITETFKTKGDRCEAILTVLNTALESSETGLPTRFSFQGKYWFTFDDGINRKSTSPKTKVITALRPRRLNFVNSDRSVLTVQDLQKVWLPGENATYLCKLTYAVPEPEIVWKIAGKTFTSDSGHVKTKSNCHPASSTNDPDYAKCEKYSRITIPAREEYNNQKVSCSYPGFMDQGKQVLEPVWKNFVMKIFYKPDPTGMDILINGHKMLSDQIEKPAGEDYNLTCAIKETGGFPKNVKKFWKMKIFDKQGPVDELVFDNNHKTIGFQNPVYSITKIKRLDRNFDVLTVTCELGFKFSRTGKTVPEQVDISAKKIKITALCK